MYDRMVTLHCLKDENKIIWLLNQGIISSDRTIHSSKRFLKIGSMTSKWSFTVRCGSNIKLKRGAGCRIGWPNVYSRLPLLLCQRSSFFVSTEGPGPVEYWWLREHILTRFCWQKCIIVFMCSTIPKMPIRKERYVIGMFRKWETPHCCLATAKHRSSQDRPVQKMEISSGRVIGVLC